MKFITYSAAVVLYKKKKNISPEYHTFPNVTAQNKLLLLQTLRMECCHGYIYE